MMMFAGAALTALDFLSGLAKSAATSAAQQSTAGTSGSAASTFALAGTSSIAATQPGRAAAGSALSADTLQTLLALQQDFKQTSSADLLSLPDGDDDGNSIPRNAVLQETQRRLQQAQMLAAAAPGQALTMSI